MPAHTKVSQNSRSQDHFKNVASKLNAPDVVDKGVIGQMKHWREDRGFGFISVATSSAFTKQDQVFCHFRALLGAVDDYAVVRFDVHWKNGKYEAANVRQIGEYEVVSENTSGNVMRWDESRELGFIEYDSNESWVRFPSTECLDDDVWVGLPVHFDLCKSVLHPDRLCAQKVRACVAVVVCEDLKGKVTHVSVSRGHGWIESGDKSFKFLTKDLISTVTVGALVCFDHVQVGDVDLALRVVRTRQPTKERRPTKEKRSNETASTVSEDSCGVFWKGWVSRTFKTTVADDEVEHAVISALACDHDFVCPASKLKNGDRVDFELEWNSSRKIWPTNIRVTDSSNQVPLSSYEGRQLATRCPKRKLLRFCVSSDQDFVHLGPKSVPKPSDGKRMSDHLSMCSTAAPLSEVA
jgi:cold shock CspA family protein